MVAKGGLLGVLGPFGLGQPLGTFGSGHFGGGNPSAPKAGTKMEKHNFLALGVRNRETKVPRYPMVVRNFFGVCVLTHWTPRGGKSENTGLGQPLDT